MDKCDRKRQRGVSVSTELEEDMESNQDTSSSTSKRRRVQHTEEIKKCKFLENGGMSP